MDIQDLQGNVVSVILIVIIAVLAITLGRDLFKKRKMLKTANAEEDSLAELLNEELSPDNYIVLQGVRLMTKLGKSKADFVIVSVYGIFCMEFRAFYKFVRADEMKQQWFYYLGLKRTPFTSPLWQSKVHIHTLKEVIGESKNIPYFPMAVFPSFDKIDEAEFEPTSFVGTYEEFLNFIDEQDKAVLTFEEAQAIARLIEAYSEKVADMENITPPEELPEEYRAFTDTKTFIDDAEEARKRKEYQEAKDMLGDELEDYDTLMADTDETHKTDNQDSNKTTDETSAADEENAADK